MIRNCDLSSGSTWALTTTATAMTNTKKAGNLDRPVQNFRDIIPPRYFTALYLVLLGDDEANLIDVCPPESVAKRERVKPAHAAENAPGSRFQILARCGFDDPLPYDVRASRGRLEECRPSLRDKVEKLDPMPHISGRNGIRVRFNPERDPRRRAHLRY